LLATSSFLKAPRCGYGLELRLKDLHALSRLTTEARQMAAWRTHVGHLVALSMHHLQATSSLIGTRGPSVPCYVIM
jgi:hypothetical protein